ncbi:hypothetical protein F5148DRAFT_676866 [Russula earlei]|uniref:Uncharacterized protein n=1 Tax=Russula earlei TaxID=71964 RepID=A0ACC0UFM0_9AGAM|nr:hypothetical protein F5148DRAFT_676866 [Russula earlei]
MPATGREVFSGVNLNGALALGLELENLPQCVRYWQLTIYIAVAGAMLIFYDWFLTSADEVDFLWRGDKRPYVRIPFFLARYPALASAIVELLPVRAVPHQPDVTRTNVMMFLRVVSIMASEVILLMRTWAIWGRSRPMFIFLAIFSTACMITAVAIAGRDVATTRTAVIIPIATDNVSEQCHLLTSAVGHLWVVPYLFLIVLEALVLSLTLYKVLQLHKGTQMRPKSKLLDALWIDGVMYFVFMLTLSTLNVALVLQVSDPQLRRGGTQMQTVFHSMLSTRIVLHIAATVKQSQGLIVS